MIHDVVMENHAQCRPPGKDGLFCCHTFLFDLSLRGCSCHMDTIIKSDLTRNVEVVGNWASWEPKEVQLPRTSTPSTTISWMTENLHRQLEILYNFINSLQQGWSLEKKKKTACSDVHKIKKIIRSLNCKYLHNLSYKCPTSFKEETTSTKTV